MNLPDRIIQIMNLLEMSPTQVAEKGEISVDSVYSIRKKQSKNPGAEILKGLSKAFNLSIDYIVSDEEVSMDVIAGKRSITAPEKNTRHGDIGVYKNAIIALDESIKKHNVTISEDLRKYFIDEIYKFAFERSLEDKTPPVIDKALVDWIVQNKLF
jgi:transcriptional regulator with XRE-family HTH domain